MTQTGEGSPGQRDYRWHEAAFYHDDAEYERLAAGFLADAARDEAPVVVLAPPRQLSLVRRTAFGGHPLVSYEDMTRLGGNPGRIIGFVRRFAADHGGGVRLLGEPIWAGRTEDELAECHRHEALINVAFDPRSDRVLCPYNVRELAPAVLADARRTHQVLVEDDRRTDSPSFDDPIDITESIQPALPPPGSDGPSMVVSGDKLSDMRGLVDRFAAAAGLPSERRADLVLAASEAASNSLVHTPRPGVLRIWRDPGAVVVEVSDTGHITDPLVGRRPPPPRAARGRGLWLINQLADLAQIRSGSGRTVVRITMRDAA